MSQVAPLFGSTISFEFCNFQRLKLRMNKGAHSSTIRVATLSNLGTFVTPCWLTLNFLTKDCSCNEINNNNIMS